MGFNGKVWALCSRVPKGKVTTYKEIAKALKTKAYRAVGNALHANPYAPRVPCHRVVNNDGRLGGYGGGVRKKTALLRKEGIKVKNSKVEDFEEALFRF